MMTVIYLALSLLQEQPIETSSICFLLTTDVCGSSWGYFYALYETREQAENWKKYEENPLEEVGEKMCPEHRNIILFLASLFWIGILTVKFVTKIFKTIEEL